ncbi:MAG: phosphoribosylanthranilate isomerase [Thermoleophilia bacterium]
MTWVKLCGNAHEEDVALCVEAGADAVGVVVEYPLPVPWTVDRARAAALLAAVPAGVDRVAVVGGDAETLVALAEATRPTALQLHLDEPEAVVEAVATRLAGSGTRLIRALRVDVESPDADAHALVEVARRLHDAGADEILLDARTRARPAGTGVPIDRTLARAVAAAAPCPVILAGGLDAASVGAAIAAVRPHGVDVISGVEGPGHRKDPGRTRAFVAAARAARG